VDVRYLFAANQVESEVGVQIGDECFGESSVVRLPGIEHHGCRQRHPRLARCGTSQRLRVAWIIMRRGYVRDDPRIGSSVI